MPRRKYKKIELRKTTDPRYGDPMVATAVNTLMRKGKKSTAESIVYGAFDIVAEKTGKDPVEVFNRALDNIKPSVKVKSRRVGGATYQVPVEVARHQSASIAMRWLVSFAGERKGMSMRRKLADELIEAAEGKGGAVKKKQDTHKMAEANRAFSHYRF
ncbi:MAG: 30S ribosomal protein S7 [bacterium]